MMKYLMSVAFVASTLSFTLAAPAAADDMAKAAGDLCETVKSCALKQMGASDMTPEMKEMMGPMLDGMCQGITASIGSVPQGHEMYAPAVACMRSMNKLGCALVENGGSAQDTPECKKYAEMAEKYSEAQP